MSKQKNDFVFLVMEVGTFVIKVLPLIVIVLPVMVLWDIVKNVVREGSGK